MHNTSTPNHRHIATLDATIFTNHFGALNTDEVILTTERAAHVQAHHPEDYIILESKLKTCIEAPDLIITDQRNPGTVYFIKRIDETNLNTVVRLALSSDNNHRKNSIMTFYRLRDKNLQKVIVKNITLYNSDKTSYH